MNDTMRRQQRHAEIVDYYIATGSQRGTAAHFGLTKARVAQIIRRLHPEGAVALRHSTRGATAGLTAKLYQVACLVADGHCDKQIAGKLNMGVPGVRSRVSAIATAWGLDRSRNIRVQITQRVLLGNMANRPALDPSQLSLLQREAVA